MGYAQKMGNHNFCDASRADGVHEAKEPGAFEVESRSHVSNHDMLGKTLSKGGDLSLEVGSLSGR